MENNKNKETKLWFKRKRYGWGWTPCSWEGWLVLAAYLILMIDTFKNINAVQHSGSDTFINFSPRFIILTLALIFICYKKGEKPKWSWGEDK